MKSTWNQEEKCRIFQCPVCGYVYKDHYSDYGKNHGEPFIACIDGVTIEVQRDYAPSKIVKLTRYICPSCGVIQVDTSSLD